MRAFVLVSAGSTTSTGPLFDMEIENQAKLEGCMASEVSMVVLDLIELLSSEFQVLTTSIFNLTCGMPMMS